MSIFSTRLYISLIQGQHHLLLSISSPKTSPVTYTGLFLSVRFLDPSEKHQNAQYLGQVLNTS